MKGMHDVHSAENHYKENGNQSNNPPKPPKTSRADYIDFEEIK